MDRLEYIFACQSDLQKELVGCDLPDVRPDLIAPYALGLFSEMGEVLQADKRWKSGLSKTGGDEKYHNEEEIVGELTDCLLYFVNLCMACNVDHEKLFKSFISVQNKVRKRNNLSEVRYADNNI